MNIRQMDREHRRLMTEVERFGHTVRAMEARAGDDEEAVRSFGAYWRLADIVADQAEAWWETRALLLENGVSEDEDLTPELLKPIARG